MIKSVAKSEDELNWISFIFRLLVASIFAAAAMNKFVDGVGKVPVAFEKMFQDTWIPAQFAAFYGRMVPYIEVILPAWLISGFRLKWAWIACCLFMITLTFGLVAAQQPAAAYNALYTLICIGGLYFSQFDRMRID